MTATSTASRLDDEQLRELLPLIASADSVELKATVPASDQRAAVTALELDPLAAQIRQVFFFDTPDLDLYAAGLVVRARRTTGKGDDTAVKLRPVDPDALGPKLRRTPGFGVEVDAMPGGFVCSASLKGRPPGDSVRTILSKGRPIRKLFTKAQRALYAERAPAGIELDDLLPLGPIFVLKGKFEPAAIRYRMVAELWLYDDGERLLELSAKCPPPETFDFAAELRVFLTERGVDLSAVQQTKTRHALEQLAGQVDAKEER